MPLIAALLLGAGAYVGFRAARHLWKQMANGSGPSEAMAPKQPFGDPVKDLGRLEPDPETGVYRPARQD